MVVFLAIVYYGNIHLCLIFVANTEFIASWSINISRIGEIIARLTPNAVTIKAEFLNSLTEAHFRSLKLN